MEKTITISIIVGSFFCTLNTQAVILNPGFESIYEGVTPLGRSTWDDPYSAMPNDWSWRKQGFMDGSTLTGTDYDTEGISCLCMFASNRGCHYAGDYLEFYQSVDLTNVQTIYFDVYLYRYAEVTTSYAAIDSRKVWIRGTSVYDRTLYDIPIDVSSLTGFHEIALGIEVFKDHPIANADGHTCFDNLRLIEIPEPCTVLLFGLGCLLIGRER